MPGIVLKRRTADTISLEAARAKPKDIIDAFRIELVSRNCELLPYDEVDVPAFEAEAEIIAFCSPDSTYAVTRRLFDAARKSILIGIYDLSAPHVKELLLDALGRRVKISLMLDIDNKTEQRLFDELVDLGVRGVPAPSCASRRGNKYFRSSHEKVIVIDDEWAVVQSGNYSANSIPLNVVDGGDPDDFRSGNRDTGLAIRSRPLAKFLKKILEADMALEITGPEALMAASRALDDAFLIEAAPTKLPAKLFPSKTFTLKKPLPIELVLSPDNYMDVIPAKLASAQKSILVEQQYIRGSQDKIKDLLGAIAAARSAHPSLDVRILLGKIFDDGDIPKEKKNLELLAKTYGLKLGANIRFVDETRFVHCHNKMVLVDGVGVLVSSQNWSKAAVWENREAGIWLEHKGICGYFTEMFHSDWEVGKKSLSAKALKIMQPEALRAGGFLPVVAADYREV